MNENFPALPQDAAARINTRIDAGVASAKRAQRRTRTIAIVAGVATVAAATTGSTMLIMQSQRDQDRTAQCYGSADPNAQKAGVGMPDQFTVVATGETHDTPTPADRVQAGIDMCWAVWKAGVLDAPDTPDRLVACVQPNNIIAVVPAFTARKAEEELCRAAGLSPVG